MEGIALNNLAPRPDIASFEETSRGISELVGRISNRSLRHICQLWTTHTGENPEWYTDPFWKGYGSAVDTSHHHAYPGGLAVHTLDVMRIALKMAEAQTNPSPDLDVLICAALYHDYAKVWDYDEHGHKNPYRKLIRHVNGSATKFMRDVEYHRWNWSASFNPDTCVEIQHAILAHHGRPEWGSPVEPQTVEAHILHYADNLSARYGVDK